LDCGGCELQQVGQNGNDISAVITKPSGISNAKNKSNLKLSVRKKGVPFFTAINQFWVLHRKLLTRSLLVLLVILLAVFIFQSRNFLNKGVENIGFALNKTFADVGFSIDEISITGQSLTNETDIVKSLGINENTSTLLFNVKNARSSILELASVLSVSVRKTYPNKIIINIVEKTPVARWRIAGKTYVIDSTGKKLASSIDGADEDLLLVVGEGASDDANAIVLALKNYPSLNEGLLAISRIADRRWDLIYKSGLRVQLPEVGFVEALAKLTSYQDEYSLLNRDLSLIDLRINDELVVRLIEHEQDAEIAQ